MTPMQFAEAVRAAVETTAGIPATTDVLPAIDERSPPGPFATVTPTQCRRTRRARGQIDITHTLEIAVIQKLRPDTQTAVIANVTNIAHNLLLHAESLIPNAMTLTEATIDPLYSAEQARSGHAIAVLTIEAADHEPQP